MDIVAVAVYNAEQEGLFVSIPPCEVGAFYATGGIVVFIKNVVNIVRNVTVRRCAITENAVVDAMIVVEISAVFTVVIRTGAFYAQATEYAVTVVLKYNVSHAGEREPVRTEKEKVYVKNVLQHIYVCI